MSNALITEKPKRRIKGFKPDYLRVAAPTPKDEEIKAAIGRAMEGPSFEALRERDRAIARTICESYDKWSAGIALGGQDFILSGHEHHEVERIEPSDLLRYAVYRYKYNKYPDLKIAEEYPPCLQIEPTSICNFRCIMCYQSDPEFSRKSSGFMGQMSLNLFRKTIDQAAGNIEAITLASRGEPLLNPDIISMLDYCRGKFLALKLNTNASVLPEETVHGILSSDLQTLVFSIDATDKEMYERIRVNGSFEQLLRNLDRFRDIRERHYSGSRLSVRITGVKINDSQDIDAMEAFWTDFADVVAFTNYNPWEGAYGNDVNDITAPCSELWRRMFVWHDGRANPCDFDYKSQLSRWSVEDRTISGIWTSPEYETLREAHLGGARSTIEPCRRCVST